MGDVIQFKEHLGGEAATKHPVIKYKSPSGADVTCESKFGSSNWKVKPGDRLEIFVNPNDPHEAEVVNFLAQWHLPLAFAIASAGSLIGAPVIYLLLKR